MNITGGLQKISGATARLWAKTLGRLPEAWLMLLLMLVTAGLAFSLYLNTLNNDMVWDDVVFVQKNSFFHHPSNIKEVLNPVNLWKVLPVTNASRPVWLTSVLIDASRSYQGFSQFRLTSMMINAFNATMLFCLVWALTGRLLPGFLCGILFATHAIHTEAVNIIVFRSHMLALFFILLGALVYIMAAKTRHTASRRALIFFSAVSYMLAMLSNETGIVFAAIIILLDIFFLEKREKIRNGLPPFSAKYLLFAGTAIIFLLFRAPRSGYDFGGIKDSFSRIIPEASASPLSPSANTEAKLRQNNFLDKPGKPPWHEVYESPLTNFLTMSRIFGGYLYKLFIPYPLQGDYNPKIIKTPASAALWASWAAWIGLGFLVFKIRKRTPLAIFGFLWMCVALAPASNVITIFNIQAERYVYIASAGFCIMLAAFSEEILASKRIRPLFAAGFSAYIILLSAITVQRNRDYRTNLDYFSATRKVDPGIPRVLTNMAAMLRGRQYFKEAENLFLEAIKYYPESVEARNSLAELYQSEGRVQDSIRTLEPIMAASPVHIRTRLNYAGALWQLNRKNEAIDTLDAGLDASPYHTPSLVILGDYAITMHRPDVYLKHFKRTDINLQPDSAKCFAAMAYAMGGDTANLDVIFGLMSDSAYASCRAGAGIWADIQNIKNKKKENGKNKNFRSKAAQSKKHQP